uniref:COMM domain containing 2 n=1 Tax=Nothoprocta perdicaria TaxID=30464 RepID=A0A8C6YM11_NOTPE
MLLVLSEEQRAHLGCLPSLVDSLVSGAGELGRLALELLRHGGAPRAVETAARSLSVDAEALQRGLDGLSFLLAESSKLMVSSAPAAPGCTCFSVNNESPRQTSRILSMFWDSRMN